MGTLVARFFHTPGAPGIVMIRRDSDGYRFDFDAGVLDFSASPTTDYSAPTEDTDFPGMSLFELVQTWTGLYQVYWYPSAAKTGKPLVLAIHLTDGAQDDLYGDLAESVRLELDANSTQLAALISDTEDLQTQIGTAGAGLTGLPVVSANIVEVNSIAIDGSGTAIDPWGPAS